MRLAHVALWTTDIDRLCTFWSDLFGAGVGDLYDSARRQGFQSRFLTLADGPTLEIMTGSWILHEAAAAVGVERAGYAHIALSLGTKAAVDALAQRAYSLNILASPPRMTGDGFYEASIRDPDGNLIEITT